jgi:uncharacterized protein
MPVTLTYPGVYVEELPSGVRTITGVSTSITAFVGYTAEGPVDKAVRIFNFGDYERAFGGLNRDSEIGYAVQQFFLNGGSDAYVVRVAKDAKPAQITLQDSTGKAVLDVSALTPGLWGNNLRLDVDYATTDPDNTFNLTVTRYDLQDSKLVPIASEQYRNLGMNSNTSNFAPRVVTSASQLIKVERPDSLTFGNGYSLSGKLNPFPTLTTSDVALSLIVDGSDPITLVLTSQPANLDELVAALTAAIATAGATARLLAERVDALGATAAGGDYVKITSQATTDRSSVEVIPAPANDASAKLKLGVSKGGREKASASFHRPAPTGTTSADLVDIVGTNVGGVINVMINDNATSTPIAIFTGATAKFTLNPTAVGPALAAALQAELRKLVSPATTNATVIFNGTSLQVTPSANTPNASILLTGAGATASRLTGTGAFNNVQQYTLGVGATFGAQVNRIGGTNGLPPDAAGLIGSFKAKTGMHALRDVDLFNLLVIPRTAQMVDAQAKSVMAAAVAFCIQERAFYIVDPHPTKTWETIGAWVDSLGIKERNAAIFFPQVLIADPLDGFRPTPMPPSGTLAGVFARTDSTRGVWKAPAGIDATLMGVQGLEQTLTDQENGALNPLGINCLRSFPVYGRVSWGARTLRGADQMADEYKYIPVRRLALFIEESLYRGTQWVVFEPNDEPLWAQIRLNLGAFMHDLFVQGAFQGKTPRDAYFVKCDRETTTQNDINKGIVNIVVGFAPLKPAEFVIIKLQQMAGQIQV